MAATGLLLAASEDLERSIFRRSVVLLFRHSRRGGARGVILSQPLARPITTVPYLASRARSQPDFQLVVHAFTPSLVCVMKRTK